MASLASRLVEPNRDHDEEPEDEEALFAELEAEIENDDSSAMREHGLAVLKQESASSSLRAVMCNTDTRVIQNGSGEGHAEQ